MLRSLPLFTLASLSLAACVPDYEYEGDYAMTYAVVTTAPGSEQPIVTAGTTRIDIRKGLADDAYFVDLGASFCALSGKLIAATTIDQVPYLDIPPQACWHADAPMSLGGNATWDKDMEHLTIVLEGSSFEPSGKPRGATTVQFTETW